LHGALANALKTQFSIEDYSRLESFMMNLPIENTDTEQTINKSPDTPAEDASLTEAGNVV
jgi:hypothetical protein